MGLEEGVCVGWCGEGVSAEGVEGGVCVLDTVECTMSSSILFARFTSLFSILMRIGYVCLELKICNAIE